MKKFPAISTRVAFNLINSKLAKFWPFIATPLFWPKYEGLKFGFWPFCPTISTDFHFNILVMWGKKRTEVSLRILSIRGRNG